MDNLQDFGSSSVSAKTIAAELKDDFYTKLVDDFLGAHYLLEQDEKPWKIRMWVQIGLMREEQEISWVDLIQWLQKIIPMFQSADFWSLIERNMAAQSQGRTFLKRLSTLSLLELYVIVLESEEEIYLKCWTFLIVQN